MVIPTTDVYGGLGTVSTDIFNSILPYVILVMGIALGFFIVEFLIDLVAQRRSDRRVDSIIAESERLMESTKHYVE